MCAKGSKDVCRRVVDYIKNHDGIVLDAVRDCLGLSLSVAVC